MAFDYNTEVISSTFNTVVHEPLYNGLVFLLSVLPHADVGIAVILLTILVKLVLFPLARQAILTQIALRRINPQLEALKVEFKDDQPEQVRKMLALYKENGIHPLSGFVTLFVQLPVILGLYWVFSQGGLPAIDTSLLYSFVKAPAEVSMHFLGLFDMGGKSLILALLAGATQFVHAYIAMEPPQTTTKPGESMKDDIMRSLHIQARYVFPVVVAVIAYTISAAVALYWITSNVFMIFQELLVRSKVRGTH